MDIALEELAESVKLYPNYAKTYNIYGLVYSVLGEDPKAEQSFRQALSLAPQDPEIRQNWGWYLCTHGRARESIPEFEAAFRNPLYKTPEVPLVNAGRCAASYGDIRAADGFYRQAVTLGRQQRRVRCSDLRRLRIAKRAARKRARWLKSMRQAILPRFALYLGCASKRKLGDRQAGASYVAQLRNRYPDGGRDEGQSSRGIASDEPDPDTIATVPAQAPPGRQPAHGGCTLLRRARRSAPVCRIDARRAAAASSRRDKWWRARSDDFAHAGTHFVRGFVRNYARLGPTATPRSRCAALADSEHRRSILRRCNRLRRRWAIARDRSATKPSWTRWAIPLVLVAIIGACGRSTEFTARLQPIGRIRLTPATQRRGCALPRRPGPAPPKNAHPLASGTRAAGLRQSAANLLRRERPDAVQRPRRGGNCRDEAR
jgi:type IV pilus assembly protein PilF